jgi:23S rRNA (adenine2503-C2)-methyltransferase
METSRSTPQRYITDLKPEAFPELAAKMGFRSFHGKILYNWVFGRQAQSFQGMTDLPQLFRERLAQEYGLHRLETVEVQQSADGTQKALFRLPDQHLIETVSIPDGDRLTLCLSTQVGCAIQCRFCASGQKGLVRNLKTGEIVEQVILSAARARSAVTNIVFMGIGEPLMNFVHLSRAIMMINDPNGIGLGARRITVSTAGLPQGIRRLAELGLQINLAISLHSADEAKRQALIPVAKHFPLKAVLEAADYYRQETTRDVTFEVLLLKGINDSEEDARKIVRLLNRRPCLVNLIPYNPVSGLPYENPGSHRTGAFRKVLEQARIPVTVRRARGTEIKAACGQLRLDHL